MAMNGNTLGDAIANIVTAADAPEDMKNKIKQTWEQIGSAIVNHIVQNAQILLPTGTVIVAVSGGSGAPAVGTTNPAPLSSTIS